MTTTDTPTPDHAYIRRHDTLVGPTFPGTWFAIVDGEVIGLRASYGYHDVLVWTWHDQPDSRETVWHTGWPCAVDPLGADLEVEAHFNAHGLAATSAGGDNAARNLRRRLDVGEITRAEYLETVVRSLGYEVSAAVNVGGRDVSVRVGVGFDDELRAYGADGAVLWASSVVDAQVQNQDCPDVYQALASLRPGASVAFGGGAAPLVVIYRRPVGGWRHKGQAPRQDTAGDPRYVMSTDPRALMTAWIGGANMGGWTDGDRDAFEAAVRREAALGFGCAPEEVDYIDIQDVDPAPVVGIIETEPADGGRWIRGVVSVFGRSARYTAFLSAGEVTFGPSPDAWLEAGELLDLADSDLLETLRDAISSEVLTWANA